MGKVRGGHIPDPRVAAGWSSVSTHTKRQVTLAALLVINEWSRRGNSVGLGLRQLDQVQQLPTLTIAVCSLE